MSTTDFLTVFGTVVLYGLVLLIVESVEIIVVYPRITRVKGYTPPTAKILIAICILLGVFLFALLCLADVLVLDRENWVYRTFGYEVAAAGFICAFSLAVTARLPQQETRTSGPRRVLFPYKFFGSLLGFFGLALILLTFALALICLVSLIFFSDRKLLHPLSECLGFPGALTWLVGYLFAKWGEKLLDIDKRANLRDGLEVLRADKRPPVLFLRGFRYDKEPFIDAYLSYSDNLSVNVNGLHPTVHIRKTFEEFLAESVRTRLGPFVALGNPEDYVPPSDEATRVYLSDTEWFDGFKQFARESACILIQVSTSDNLNHELQFILSTKLQTKLYILTPPELFDLGASVLVHVHLAPRSFSWPEFAGRLNQLGYNAPEDCMPNGAVIGFDSGGKAEIVITDAKSAADYISAIESRLLSNEVKT